MERMVSIFPCHMQINSRNVVVLNVKVKTITLHKAWHVLVSSQNIFIKEASRQYYHYYYTHSNSKFGSGTEYVPIPSPGCTTGKPRLTPGLSNPSLKSPVVKGDSFQCFFLSPERP